MHEQKSRDGLIVKYISMVRKSGNTKRRYTARELTYTWNYPNGKTSMELVKVHSRSGIQLIKSTTWFTDGKKESETHYTTSNPWEPLLSSEKRMLTSEHWHPSGHRRLKRTWKNGEIMDETYWHKNGKVHSETTQN